MKLSLSRSGLLCVGEPPVGVVHILAQLRGGKQPLDVVEKYPGLSLFDVADAERAAHAYLALSYLRAPDRVSLDAVQRILKQVELADVIQVCSLYHQYGIQP